MRHFSYKKAVQALNLFAVWGGGSTNKMKSLKLLWLADRLHLNKYGRPIINDTYVAMENGPVASETRDIIQSNAIGTSKEALSYAQEYLESSGYDYKSKAAPVEKVFSKSDLTILRMIFDAYGVHGKYKVRDLSHEFPEWKRWEDGLKKKIYKSHKMDYDDFFSEPDGDHPLFCDRESTKLAFQFFKRQD
jgi:uncharacterized phage-associated protein